MDGLGRGDIAGLDVPLFQHQDQVRAYGAGNKSTRAHLVTGERFGAGRTGEDRLEALGDEVRRQVSPVRSHRHAFAVLNHMTVSVQVYIRVRVRRHTDTEL